MNPPLEWTFNSAVTNTVVDAVSQLTGATLGGTPGTANNKIFPGGVLRGWDLNSPGAADVFLQIFGQPASTVTLGTTVPILSIKVPNAGANVLLDRTRTPLVSGFSYAVTATAGGSGAPVAAMDVRVAYEGG